MATIYQSEFIQKAVKNLRLAQAREKIPSEIADKVLLTYSINHPFNIQCKNAQLPNGTSATIHTCSNVADTYIISAEISMVKDVTSTSANTYLAVTPFDLVAARLLQITGITLVAQSDTASINCPIPMKLARGSTISINNTTNVANINASGSILYFEVPD